MARKPPPDQTNEEWLRDYDGEPGPDHYLDTSTAKKDFRSAGTNTSEPNRGLYVVPATGSNHKTLIGEFIYREHRTTKDSRLVLEFMHIETGEIVSMFFNVLLVSPRGKNYPAKRCGQFTCSSNYRFAKFWLSLFKKPPRRPCRAHHELSRLKKLKLVGEAVLKNKKDGSGSYWELVKLKRIPVGMHTECT